MYILGISAFYHDSAAALVKGPEIVAAAQEERFSRVKHDSSFPAQAIESCLEEGHIKLSDVSYVVYYEKPFVKFERLLETYLHYAPKGLASFKLSMPIWMKEKLFLKRRLNLDLAKVLNDPKGKVPPVLFSEHHGSHAASAFYPSPFQRAAVLCLDGVGEWATTSCWIGDGEKLSLQWEIDFPHSLGLLYSAFTYYTGFKVNSGEYKLMGLAPYGTPRFSSIIREHLIDIKEDGSFRLNMEYFDFPVGSTMTNWKFERLFGGPPRAPEALITQKEMDLGASIQQVLEESILRLASTVHRETKLDHLCLAGGVALNCVANGRLRREGPFKDIWIQPAAGDAGGALGAALNVWHQHLQRPRQLKDGSSPSWSPARDQMHGSLLGPAFSKEEVESALQAYGASYEYIEDEDKLCELVAKMLDQGQVVGWFQGRMEFGPRALGNRSILGDPRDPQMQKTMNLKIKFRESFRPFAPAILVEDALEYFQLKGEDPYMLQTSFAQAGKASLPAVTHVDQSARVQTVDGWHNPRFHRLLGHFKQRTGCPVLVNTSFNVRGEPIVSHPCDAYRCFMNTHIDCLVVDNFVLYKKDQPVHERSGDFPSAFPRD